MPNFAAFYLGLHCLQSIGLGVPSLQNRRLIDCFWLISGESGIHLERDMCVGTDSPY